MAAQTLTIMAVDDEPDALSALRRCITAALPEAQVVCFGWPDDALAYAREHEVDVAFLDIKMGGMTGLTLARHLKDACGRTNIIFVTGYSDYAADAISLRASGYILKPPDAAQILVEMENLRHPIETADRGVRFQCFGNFEVFVDGTPIAFGRRKAKEALAYLVDRHGASVTKRQLAAILWEDELYDRRMEKRLDNVLSDMLRTLRDAGAEDIIFKKSGLYAVDASRITCDAYRYEQGVAAAVNSYHGEYMTNYSWAEFTAGRLIR